MLLLLLVLLLLFHIKYPLFYIFVESFKSNKKKIESNGISFFVIVEAEERERETVENRKICTKRGFSLNLSIKLIINLYFLSISRDWPQPQPWLHTHIHEHAYTLHTFTCIHRIQHSKGAVLHLHTHTHTHNSSSK